MAINTLEFATKMSSELDKAVAQKTVTGFLADNVLRAKFVGCRTVLIPEMGMSGLADYDRDTGFIRGSISVTNKPFTLSMDRGRSFQIDAQDEDETGIAGLAGQILGEFVRTKVVPEMDAYCLSKLAGYAVTKSQTVTAATGKTLADSVYSLFADAMSKAQNAIGYDEELVCFVNNAAWTAMMTTPEISRQIVTSNFKQGAIDLTVKSINGVALRPVSDSRMKSAYTFYDGTTSGQTDGGFAPTSAAKNIGILILPKKAASLVKKTEKMRVFEPAKNLDADAWKFDYRIYYDVFVKNSMGGGIYAYTY